MSEFIEVRQAAAHKIAAAVAFDLRKAVKTNFRGCRDDTAMAAADVIDGLMQQRDELLEALKGMHKIVDAMGDMPDSAISAKVWFDLKCEEAVEQSFEAITKAEAAE